MNQELSTTRSYRGQSQEQRRAERRGRLIAGAIAVYGERGYHQATVKAVCEAAGLTERYFYESFANSEALLIDSYNAVAFAVLRVFLLEIRGVSRAVDQAFDASLRTIGHEVARLLAPEAVDDELLQAGVIGGVIHIALRWIEDGYAPPIDGTVATALRLGTALAAPPRARTRRARSPLA